MVAILYFAGVVLAGGVVGALVWRSQRGAHWLWSLAIGLPLALVLAVVSGAVFFYAALIFPTADDPKYAGNNSIYILREDNFPDPNSKQAERILLTFPFDVQKGSDFPVRLELSAGPTPISAGIYSSAFAAPKLLEARPQSNCKDTPPASACNTLARSSELITLSWDITPTSEGDALVRISIPPIWAVGDTWKAGLEFDGRKAVFSPDAQCNKNRWMESMDGGCGPVLPLLLDVHAPHFVLTTNTPTLFSLPYAYHGAEVDFENLQIRFPIRVTTSLGLTAQTYAWLALAGSVLSGFLGSGWGWKLVDIFKSNTPKLPQVVTERREGRKERRR